MKTGTSERRSEVENAPNTIETPGSSLSSTQNPSTFVEEYHSLFFRVYRMYVFISLPSLCLWLAQNEAAVSFPLLRFDSALV